MQHSIYFENEIVQASNLNFDISSDQKNTKDNFNTIFKGIAGISTGWTLSSSGSSAIISTGIGYDANGERIESFAPTSIISPSGSHTLFATFSLSNYNPDPSASDHIIAVTNINAITGSGEAVRSYNAPLFTFTSGNSYIPVGRVINNGITITSILTTEPYRIDLKIAGVIDVNSVSIDGSLIAPSSIDSTKMKNPWTTDIVLGSGVNILTSGDSHLGSLSEPFSEAYITKATIHEIVGFSPTIIHDITQASGSTIESVSGQRLKFDSLSHGSDFGGNVYTNNVTSKGSDLSINAVNQISLTSTTFSNIASSSITNHSNNGNIINSSTTGDISNSSATGDISNSTGSGDINNNAQHINLTAQQSIVLDSALTNSDDTIFSIVNSNKFNETFENLVPNPDFSSINIYPSGAKIPDSWIVTSISSGSTIYVGPFANGSSFLSIPESLNLDMQGLATYTIEADIKLNSYNNTTSSHFNTIYSQITTDGNNPRFEIGGNVSPHGQGSLYWDDNGADLSSAPGTIALSQWYHVAFTFASGTNTSNIYVDNINVASGTSANYRFNSNIIQSFIGSFANGLSNIDGYIDNVRISNIARTTFPSGLSNHLPNDISTIANYTFSNNYKDSAGGYDLINVGVIPFTDLNDYQSINYDVRDFNDDFSVKQNANSNYYLNVSGSNITTDGFRISSSLGELKPNTSYNISFWHKDIANANNLKYSCGLRGFDEFGTLRYNTPLVIASQTNWNRESFTITTPIITGSTSAIYYDIQMTPMAIAGTVNPSLQITGVQVTEGIALLPNIKSYPRNLINSFSSEFQNLNNWTDVLGFNFQEIITSGRNIKVKSKINVATLIGNSCFFKLLIDRKQVDSSTFRYSGSGSTFVFGSIELNWEGYLPSGKHTFRVVGMSDHAGVASINTDPAYGLPTSTFIVTEF